MQHDANFSLDTRKPEADNRRRYARLPAQNCAAIQAPGARKQTMGVLQNVSADGLAMQTDKPPAVGTEVTVHVLIFGSIHALTARVAHITQKDNFLYLVGLYCDLLLLQDDGVVARALGVGGLDVGPSIDN